MRDTESFASEDEQPSGGIQEVVGDIRQSSVPRRSVSLITDARTMTTQLPQPHHFASTLNDNRTVIGERLPRSYFYNVSSWKRQPRSNGAIAPLLSNCQRSLGDRIELSMHGTPNYGACKSLVRRLSVQRVDTSANVGHRLNVDRLLRSVLTVPTALTVPS